MGNYSSTALSSSSHNNQTITQCQYIFRRGDNTNQQCSSVVENGNRYCDNCRYRHRHEF